MQITTTKLTRAAGLAAVASGALFIAVQVRHPEITSTSSPPRSGRCARA